jgi:hypothetical protein
MDFLVHALRGLRQLDIDVLHTLGFANETIDSASQIDLPTDAIGIVGVYIERGDKIQPLYRNKKINPKTGNVTYPIETYEDMLDENVSPFLYSYFKGREFIKGLNWTDWWREIPEEGKIRVDNRYTGEELLVVYVKMSKKVNNQTIVPAIAEDAVLEFINWQYSRFHPTNRFDHKTNRREFYNEKRKLRGRKFEFNIDEYTRRLRTQEA